MAAISSLPARYFFSPLTEKALFAAGSADNVTHSWPEYRVSDRLAINMQQMVSHLTAETVNQHHDTYDTCGHSFVIIVELIL